MTYNIMVAISILVYLISIFINVKFIYNDPENLESRGLRWLYYFLVYFPVFNMVMPIFLLIFYIFVLLVQFFKIPYKLYLEKRKEKLRLKYINIDPYGEENWDE